MERAHVPFIVVLVRTLQKWKAEVRRNRFQDEAARSHIHPSVVQHDDSLPDPSKDRKAFTDQVWACKHPDEQDAENVEEGVTALNSHVWRPIRQLSADKTYPGVPDDIKALFKDPACDQLNFNSSNFWILTRALRDFVQAKAADEIPGGEGYLPQPGSLPDMKAISATYIEMQRLYHSKAEADLASFTKYLEKVLHSTGVTAAIPEQEIRTFVKHAAFLKVIRGKKLHDQHQQPNAVDTCEKRILGPRKQRKSSTADLRCRQSPRSAKQFNRPPCRITLRSLRHPNSSASIRDIREPARRSVGSHRQLSPRPMTIRRK